MSAVHFTQVYCRQAVMFSLPSADLSTLNPQSQMRCGAAHATSPAQNMFRCPQPSCQVWLHAKAWNAWEASRALSSVTCHISCCLMRVKKQYHSPVSPSPNRAATETQLISVSIMTISLWVQQYAKIQFGTVYSLHGADNCQVAATLKLRTVRAAAAEVDLCEDL